MQKVSGPFDIPVKKCKIKHYRQSFCFAPHKPTSNLNILKANLDMELYKGIIMFVENFLQLKIHNISMGMNKVQGRPPFSQCSSLSLSLFFS